MGKEEEKEPKEEQEPKSMGPPKSLFREYFESFTVTLVMAIFGMTFILQAVTVPTGSMQNTILVGDYLLVNKFIFNPGGDPLPFLPMREIQRGDIIVFKYPGDAVIRKTDRDRGSGQVPDQLRKARDRLAGRDCRVQGQSGLYQRPAAARAPRHRRCARRDVAHLRRVSSNSGSRKRNGTFITTKIRCQTGRSGRALRLEHWDFGVAGKTDEGSAESVFCAWATAATDSDDSRGWGFVPRELIIGRAMFVYWSCDRAASNGSFFGCLTHPRLNRIGKFVK